MRPRAIAVLVSGSSGSNKSVIELCDVCEICDQYQLYQQIAVPALLATSSKSRRTSALKRVASAARFRASVAVFCCTDQ